jgi:hypothetical protein
MLPDTANRDDATPDEVIGRAPFAVLGDGSLSELRDINDWPLLARSLSCRRSLSGRPLSVKVLLPPFVVDGPEDYSGRKHMITEARDIHDDN